MNSAQRLAMLGLGLALGLIGWPASGRAAGEPPLVRLLETRSCPACKLQDADLAQADLRDSQLRGAQLQRADLSGAQLDGADLSGANLSFTSLAGASLRGADLRGSQLLGTDLRQADLSGALLSPGALSRSHWQEAQGLNLALLSYSELHNAGVAAARDGRYPEAEHLFGEAIRRLPEAAISWVARGISRTEQGKNAEGAQDLRHASALYQQMGDLSQAQQLSKAAEGLTTPPKPARSGNGIGAGLAGGAMSAIQLLAPIAIKAFAPAFF